MPRIILHIGTGKTGTSAIQSFLYKHKESLAVRGVEYPELGMSVIDHFGEQIPAHYPLCDWLRKGDTAKLARWSTMICRSHAAEIVFSCENFYHKLGELQIQRLADLLKGREVCVVTYVRPQDDYIVSAWKQQVKVGEIKAPFSALLDRHKAADFLGASHANYRRMLKPWVSAFGIESMRLGVFDKVELEGQGGLLADFFKVSGLDLPSHLLGSAAPVRNDALPTELLLLLRHANWRGSVPSDRSAFVSYLAKNFRFANPPLLNMADRQAVLANYREENLALFNELGHGRIPSCFFDLEHKPAESASSATPTLPRPEDIAIQCLIQGWKDGVSIGNANPAPADNALVPKSDAGTETMRRRWRLPWPKRS